MEKRIILITGANKGIGLETARQLGQQGHTVLVGARDAARGQEAVDKLVRDGIDAHLVQLDVTDADSIARAARSIGERFGRLDTLINNAGISSEERDSKPSQVPLTAWRTTYEVNLFAVVAVTQAMLPLIKKSPAGRIVNVSSILGSLTLHSDPASQIYSSLRVAYNSSKSALNQYTVHLAVELKDTPIKVNAAHPGWVKTDLGGSEAPLEVSDGAKTSVWLATLPADGPSGGYFFMRDSLPW
jgi:NAD(P)-dependent dehydrogenase (short-subunit alcohol dehydrogenase family)